MHFINQFKQHVSESRWMSLVAVILLLLSVSLTVRIVQLQQDLRQRAGGPTCQANEGADCGNNGKSCCSGLTCVPKPQGNGGKCQFVAAAPTPTTSYAPPVYVPPTESSGSTQGEPPPDTSGGAIGGIGPTPVPVACGPNGCGWSPRPEGEKSTTEAPPVEVCTISFNGPKQLVGTRLSSTSIRFNWWPTPGGADKQFIMYGLESGKALWGMVNVAGDTGQIAVDHLPANRTIWAQVRAYRGPCYEDTGWISVGSVRQVGRANNVVQQTVAPSPVSTLKPTSIAMNNYISPTPVKSKGNGLILIGATWNIPWLLALLAILFIIAFIFRKQLLLFLFKKKKKKEQEN